MYLYKIIYKALYRYKKQVTEKYVQQPPCTFKKKLYTYTGIFGTCIHIPPEYIK